MDLPGPGRRRTYVPNYENYGTPLPKDCCGREDDEPSILALQRGRFDFYEVGSHHKPRYHTTPHGTQYQFQVLEIAASRSSCLVG